MKTSELIREKLYYQKAILFIGLLSCFNLYSQTIQEKLILSCSKDSIFLNLNNIHFDKEGNFCFITKKNGKKIFVSNKDMSVGFDKISSMWGYCTEIHIATNDIDSADERWFYTNKRGREVFGPIQGKLEKLISGIKPNKIALLVTFKDSVYFYYPKR